MARQAKRRDPEEEARERDRFVILLHMHTMSDATAGGPLPTDRILKDLGFTRARADQLLESLYLAEYIRWTGLGDGVTLSRMGRDYIERLAGRRRSVRLVH